MDRYFYKIDKSGEIKVIYRLIKDDSRKIVRELKWESNSWVTTQDLIKMIIDGDMNLEEVTKSQIDQITPFVDTSEYTGL